MVTKKKNLAQFCFSVVQPNTILLLLIRTITSLFSYWSYGVCLEQNAYAILFVEENNHHSRKTLKKLSYTFSSYSQFLLTRVCSLARDHFFVVMLLARFVQKAAISYLQRNVPCHHCQQDYPNVHDFVPILHAVWQRRIPSPPYNGPYPHQQAFCI